MSKIKVGLSVVLLLLNIFCCGCWGRKEISQTAIVLGTAVDYVQGEELVLTLQIAKPGSEAAENGDSGESKGNHTLIVSAAGKTITDAASNIEKSLSRRLYWGHGVVLIMGEELAKQDMREITNFFNRYHESRETVWVMVSEGSAQKVLESQPLLEDSSAKALAGIAKQRAGFAIQYYQFIQDLLKPGSNPVASRIGFIKQTTAKKGKKGQDVVGFKGTAVFKKGKLVGWLDNDETRGMMWLRKEIKKGVVSIPSPEKPNKNLSFVIIEPGQTKITPVYDGKTLRFQVKVIFEGDMVEQQYTEDITNPQMKAELERLLSQGIENNIRSALSKAQGEYKVDIFHFNDAFHRKYKKEWRQLEKQWDEVFANAQIELSVESRIRRTGMTGERKKFNK